MAYVEAHASLREHPKTKKLARLLSISRASAIGHLLCLWWWCQEYADNGDLSAYEPADIAEAADWDGEPAELIDALLNCGTKGNAGFLARNEDGALLVNDWHEYGGKLSLRREQARERMRTLRNKENPVTRTFASRDANVTHDVRDVTHIDQIRSDKIRSDKKIEDAVRVTNDENSVSDCLSDCLSSATHLIQQHNLKPSQYMIDQVSRAISEYGLPLVESAFASAADKGKIDSWNYVKGTIGGMAKPAKPSTNGARHLPNVAGGIPEDVV